jgi:hypothetical protein
VAVHLTPLALSAFTSSASPESSIHSNVAELQKASNSALPVVEMEIFSLRALLFFFAVLSSTNANLEIAKQQTSLLSRVESERLTLLCSCVMILPYCQAHIIVKYETNLLWWRRRRRRALNNNNDDRERPVWEKSVALPCRRRRHFCFFFSFVSRAACVCVARYSVRDRILRGARAFVPTFELLFAWFDMKSFRGNEFLALGEKYRVWLCSPSAPMTQGSVCMWLREIS